MEVLMPDTQSPKTQMVKSVERIILPLPPEHPIESDKVEMDMYARFMRHVRTVPTSREDIRVLSTIQFVADMMVFDDAYVAKVLVDLGLRAPRVSFPERYLEFVDAAMMREVTEIGSANPAMWDLKRHWDEIGEDKFAAFKRDVPRVEAGCFETVCL